MAKLRGEMAMQKRDAEAIWQDEKKRWTEEKDRFENEIADLGRSEVSSFFNLSNLRNSLEISLMIWRIN